MSYSFSRIGNLCSFIVEPYTASSLINISLQLTISDSSSTTRTIINKSSDYAISNCTVTLSQSTLTYSFQTSFSGFSYIVTPRPAIWHAYDSRSVSGASGAGEGDATVTITPVVEPEP